MLFSILRILLCKQGFEPKQKLHNYFIIFIAIKMLILSLMLKLIYYLKKLMYLPLELHGTYRK